MKRKINNSVLIIIILICRTVSAEETLDDWLCYKPVSVQGDSNYIYFFLDKDVYKYADSTLKDIRIADSEGGFVPYYFSIESFEEKREELKFFSALLSTQEDDDGNSYFDFHFIPVVDEEVRGQKLVFDITAADYSRQIEIYGREEKTDWVYIGQDTVYNINGKVKNEIEFSGLKFYDLYRIKVVENNGEIYINGSTLICDEKNAFYNEFVKQVSLEFEIYEEENYSFITINNPYSLRLKNIELSVIGNFDREYGVYSEDMERRIKAGRIFSMNFKDTDILETKIGFNNSPVSLNEFIIRIDNRDARPLEIEKINAEYYTDKVVFEDIGTGPYTLYFGNDSASKPKYDIENFKELIENEDQNEAVLGSTVVTGVKDVPDEDDFKWMFNIIIISIAVILFIFLALVLRKK